MPTKRTRISRHRLEREVPGWAQRLRDEGQPPEREGGPDWSAFVEWKFFGSRVPGLPLARSPEGRRLVERARGYTDA